MDLEPVPITGEPGPDVCMLVVRGIVLNENGVLATVVYGKLFEEGEVGLGIEHFVLPVPEPRVVQLYGTKDLHALALAGHWHLWRMADP